MELADHIKGCRKQKPRSQKALYDGLCGRMYAVCLRYCKNENDAADVLQEGFVKVFSNIDQLNDDRKIEAWAKMIMVRTALKMIRRENIYVSLDDSIEVGVEYEMDIDFDRFTYDKLMRHLKSLPIGYQTVFNLFVFEELSHHEIAVELGCSEGTSRSQLYKARKMLQEKINEDRELIHLLSYRS